MRVLVVGASGGIGQWVIKQLVAGHHQAIGMIRNPDQEDMIVKLGGVPRMGDLAQDITDVAEGCDAVIAVFGAKDESTEKEYMLTVHGLKKLIDSALRYHVKQFLYVSSLNIDIPQAVFIKDLDDFYGDNKNEEYNMLRSLFGSDDYVAYVAAKKEAEQLLIHSGLNYVILRAGVLTHEAPVGTISLTKKPRGMGRLSRGDVAETFVEALGVETLNNKVFYLLDGTVKIKQALSAI